MNPLISYTYNFYQLINTPYYELLKRITIKKKQNQTKVFNRKKKATHISSHELFQNSKRSGKIVWRQNRLWDQHIKPASSLFLFSSLDQLFCKSGPCHGQGFGVQVEFSMFLEQDTALGRELLVPVVEKKQGTDAGQDVKAH